MEKLPEASGMLLWGVLVKSLFIIVGVVHFSTSFYDKASVILTLVFSAYCAIHSMVVESVFELLMFLLLSFGTTLWFGVVLAHSYGLLFVLAAVFSLDMFFLTLIVLLPSSICSSFGYYHFRISAVVKIQAMYHGYQSFVTLLKLDMYVTLLFLVRAIEHFGWQSTAVLVFVVGLCSFFLGSAMLAKCTSRGGRDVTSIAVFVLGATYGCCLFDGPTAEGLVSCVFLCTLYSRGPDAICVCYQLCTCFR
jgi:hypothetical protein